MADEPTGNLDQATSMEIMQIFTDRYLYSNSSSRFYKEILHYNK